MKVARLVIGIITMIVSMVVFFLGIALGINNSYASYNGVPSEYTQGGGWQIVIALFLLAGGIVMTTCHNKGALGGCIACVVLFAIALIIGIVAGWGNILSVLYLIAVLIFSIVGIPLAAKQKRLEQEKALLLQQQMAQQYWRREQYYDYTNPDEYPGQDDKQ